MTAVAAEKADEMAKAFAVPPDSAKPHTWWQWMNGNITKEGITADLEAMKQVGVGGAQIFNVNSGIPAGPIKFMSPPWREMMKHAAKEADRLGIELCIHNCAGWSSSGGPWNTPEHAMQVVVTSEQHVHGPAKVDITVPQPPTKLNCYRDIAVVAFPTPAGESTRMKDSLKKVTTSAGKSGGEQLVDGKTETSVGFAVPQPKAPQFIRLEFAKPFTARLLTLTPGVAMHGCNGTIETSDDGKTFRKLALFSMPQSDRKQTYVFPPVTARFYRINFVRTQPTMKRLWIADVELSPRVGIESVSAKAFYDRGASSPQGSNIPASAEAMIPGDRIIDLTSRMAADGKLTWDAPEGEWTILRLGYTPNGRTNHPASAEGTGLECDKLNKEAAEAHWAGMMGKIIDDLGPLAGKTLNNVLIDSYEVGGQNWTPKFREEFQRLQGYDVLKFLPVFTGRVVESQEITERFLWDLRRTIADLFAENYVGAFAEMAHKAGMQFSIEPYGNGPFDDLQCGGYGDIIMGEFWTGRGSGGSTKLAAAVAHVYGRKIVGAEAFTARPEEGRWLDDPFSMKALGDAVYCAGVNRMIFHRFAHQPWLDRFPGMTMGQWGFHFDRTSTIWEQRSAWLKYLARCQYLLQSGLFVGDVCFFSGDGAPNSLLAGGLPPGYDYDGCSADALMHRMTVKDGRIALPDGMSYRVLVLPNEKAMTPATLRKIKELVESGATVVGPKPVRSPSLADYPNCDAEVKRLADELWDQGLVGQSADEALVKLKVPPDISFDEGIARLAYIHRVVDGTDVYFVSNQSDESVEFPCSFRIDGKTPELWHPDTGQIERAPVFEQHAGRTIVPLRFDPAGSVFVVFRQPATADHLVSARWSGEPVQSARPPAKLVILKAEYGFFSDEHQVARQVADITDKLAALVANGKLLVTAGNELAGHDPAPMIEKELRVEYEYQGARKLACVKERHKLRLPEKGERIAAPPAYELATTADGAIEVQAWQPGVVEGKTAAGKTLKAEAVEVAKPVELAGPWEVRFPPKWGAPEKIALDRLISWTEYPDSGVKYFSGTATYRTTFDWQPPAASSSSLFLDLGRVKNIAEVRLNGRDLGILWKTPFRVAITDAAKPGKNDLEIRVTNLWPNRLIGDEQLPADCQWRENGALKAWPQWLLDGKTSPNGRLTFTTWHHWKKDDPLLPSGLLGPVMLRTTTDVRLSQQPSP